MRWALCLSLVLATVGGLSACTPDSTGHLPGADFDPTVRTSDPALLLAILGNAHTPEASRKSADEKYVAQKGKTDTARRNILEQMLYAPEERDAMRIYAMDQLADADPARAGFDLTLYLP